jgi:tetratricopeptide (TPR) repeat protein
MNLNKLDASEGIQYKSDDIKKKPKAELLVNVDRSKKPKKPVDRAKVRRAVKTYSLAAIALFVVAGAIFGMCALIANQPDPQPDGPDTSALAQPGEEGMEEREFAAVRSKSDEQQQAILDDYDRAIQRAEQTQDSDQAFDLAYAKAGFLNNTGRYEDAITAYESLLSQAPDDVTRVDLYCSIINSAHGGGISATVVSYIQRLFALPEDLRTRTNLNLDYYQRILDKHQKELAK